MTTKNEISQSGFERLLKWLDADREEAGRKYESIRSRLIKIFYARGCPLAEEMTDETINRVSEKAELFFETYHGEPELYFHAVAKKVILEYSRHPKTVELPAEITGQNSPDKDIETYYECLDKCLQNFAPVQREFIVKYYSAEKRAKLDERKKMERDLGISNDALRIRAFRIRKILQKCVSACVEEMASVTFSAKLT